MTNASPNFAEFKRLAQQGNVVPVYRTIVADLLSPVSAFLSLSPQHGRESNSHPHSFLLESVEGGERVGRYTFFGMDPFQIVKEFVYIRHKFIFFRQFKGTFLFIDRT